MATLRILIADDHELVRQGLRSLLASRPAWEVCGEAADGREAVEKASQLKPDIILLDVSMPRLNGLEAAALIRRKSPGSEILIVSQHDPAQMLPSALKAGARGFVSKSEVARNLLSTIESIVEPAQSPDAAASGAGLEPVPAFLTGGGEMGAVIRSMNWAETPLGPVESWSPTLRTMTRFLLANRFPLLLWWGPDFCNLYNDAYRPILGSKHPGAMGQPVRETWSEIWHVLKPLIETPYRGGPSTWMEDFSPEVNRHGFLEETHFTIAYSPVPDETVPGGIGGVLATVHEITEKVIGERRNAVLRDLGARSAEPETAEEACAIAAETLTRHVRDIPFALLYLIDPTRTRAQLAGVAGLEASADAALREVALAPDSGQVWPLALATESEAMQLVEDVSAAIMQLPCGPWSEPPRRACVVPIRSTIPHRLAGFLVAGISPRLRFDEGYRDFLELVSAQIATTIANARSYEEERRRAEALAEIDRAKTSFFSNVSHEFRTPLTLMLGPLENLLARDPKALSYEVRSELELVARNGERLLRLVNALLDFARIEGGRVRASYQPTNLATLTADLASSFRSATEQAGLTLSIDCRAVPPSVCVDREMWEKIVLNLLSNAFKFTFEGGIAITLQRLGETLELRVRDSGVGIPEEELPKVFERFHRVHNARSRTHEGSGIGLALVQELVKLHGGTVRVESALGRGSTFTVTMPLRQEPPAAQADDTARPPATAATAAAPFVAEALRWLPDTAGAALPASVTSSEPRAKVLIADDNADMRGYLSRLLAARYEVRAFADGQQALAAVRAEPPDLIVSDIMMPNLDGFGLVRQLRLDPRTRTLPIILLSARAGEDSCVEGLDAGADDYLVKPFGARELLARVQVHLELASVRRDAQRAVRESEEQLQLAQRFRTLFESIDEGFCVLEKVRDGDAAGESSDFRFLQANPGFATQTGIDDVVDRTLREVFPTEAERGFLNYDSVLASGESRKFEHGSLREGRVLDVYAFRVEDGSRTRIALICKDITDRKRAEAFMLCQKDAFEKAASGMPLMEVLEFLAQRMEIHLGDQPLVAIHLLDPSGTRFAHAAAPGLPPGYASVVATDDVSSPADPCCVAVSRGERVAVMDAAASREFPQYAAFAARHQLRSGWFLPIFSSAGKPLGAFACHYAATRRPQMRDSLLGGMLTRTASIIIERKQVEEMLRQRSAQFEILLNQAPLGVYLVDGDLRIRQVNPIARPTFGAIEDLEGRDFSEVIHLLREQNYADEIVRTFRTTLRTGESHHASERARPRLDGKGSDYFEWHIDRIPLPEGGHGVVCYFRDISQEVQARAALREARDNLESRVRERTEELEQAYKSLRVMSMRMMQMQDEDRRRIARDLHDSAGQLVAALGMELAALNMRAAATAPALANDIEASNQLVQQLTQEIRTASYLLHPPLLDDAGLSGALRWYVSGLSKRSGIAITLELDEELGRLPRELEAAVFHIVQESLMNIHRHSGSKTAALRIARHGAQIFLEIEDQGIGLSADKLHDIQMQGSGVGIAGMRERVVHFKGDMHISSGSSGTRIAVTFPLPAESAEQRDAAWGEPAPRIVF